MGGGAARESAPAAQSRTLAQADRRPREFPRVATAADATVFIQARGTHAGPDPPPLLIPNNAFFCERREKN